MWSWNRDRCRWIMHRFYFVWEPWWLAEFHSMLPNWLISISNSFQMISTFWQTWKNFSSRTQGWSDDCFTAVRSFIYLSIDGKSKASCCGIVHKEFLHRMENIFLGEVSLISKGNICQISHITFFCKCLLKIKRSIGSITPQMFTFNPSAAFVFLLNQ